MREWAGRGRWVDPLAVGLVAAGVYALRGWHGWLDHDLGVFVYGGMRVADGVPPYVGIFNSVGPLADLVPGLGIWLGRLVGLDDPVLASRLLFWAISAGCVALVCVLGRDALGRRAGGIVAASAFLTFEQFTVLAGSGPREKTTMVLFLLGAVILAGRRRWLGAGVCTALATLTWQPVVLVALAVVVVAIAGAAGRRVRAIGLVVLGGLIPSALTVAYFAAYGHLRLAVDGFLFINLQDTEQPSAWSDPRWVWDALWHGYHASLLLILTGLAVLVTAAVVSLAQRRPADPTIALGAGAVAGLGWTSYAVNGAPDLFVLLPFAATGVAIAGLALTSRLRAPLGRRVLAAVATTCVVLAGLQAASRRNDDLDRQRAEVAAVVAAAPAATWVSFDAPNAMVLADHVNPSRYQLFHIGKEHWLHSHHPGGLAGLATRIARIDPTILVTDHDGIPLWAQHALDPSYVEAGRSKSWIWYVARSAGPDVVDQVAAAVSPAGSGADRREP